MPLEQQHPSSEAATGELTWAQRSALGMLRGVMDPADVGGRRNLYMHTVHTKALARELRRSAPVKRALDFGCGTGRLLRTLARSSAEVYGLDCEPAMVRAAWRYAQRYVTDIECWDEERTPFPASFFDFILCSSVLSVTEPEFFDRSLREMARMAQPKATLVLLDKVAPASGLALQRYFTGLSSAGFEPLRAYALRPAQSWYTALVTKYQWIPPWTYGMFAELELARAARRYHGENTGAYVQYAIVARRND